MAAATSTGRRSLRPLAAAALAAVVFLAGMAARGALGAGGEATEAQAGAAAAAEDAVTDDGGFERTRRGARAAAITYAATLSQRLLYLEPDAAAAAVREVAALASADTIAAETVESLTAAREPLSAGSGATWWVVQPLAVRVDAYASDRARVSVWVVRVLSRQGVVVPQSSWLTESVDLVWERGDWHLWATTSTPGPTPVLDGSDMPASAAELEDDLAGFELLVDAVVAT